VDVLARFLVGAFVLALIFSVVGALLFTFDVTFLPGWIAAQTGILAILVAPLSYLVTLIYSWGWMVFFAFWIIGFILWFIGFLVLIGFLWMLGVKVQ
jgi:hypothetical protein